MSKGSLREQMPETAAFIDSLRAAFGADMIDAQIRKGLKGAPVFYASENGYTIGTPIERGKVIIKWDERGIAYQAQD
jgi:hypothetical protein